MLPQNHRVIVFTICTIFVICCTNIFAAQLDYDNGYTDGSAAAGGGGVIGYAPASAYLPGVIMPAYYLAVWQSDPTQANWDYYYGYYDGFNGYQPRVYAAIPAMPASSTNQLLTFQQVHLGSNRLLRNFRSLTRGFRLGGSRLGRLRTEAGDVFQDVTFSVQGSRASVDDDLLGGSGHDTEAGLLLSARVGENVDVSLGIAQDWYEIDAADWDESVVNYDLIMSYRVLENCSVGLFLNFSQTDVEDQKIGGGTVAGYYRDRWGGGLLASYNMDLASNLNWGVTGALTSMNKKSIGRFFDNEDSAGLLLTDLNVAMTDAISADFYVSYFGLLDRETGGSTAVGDGSYYTMGVDLGVRTGKNSELSIGYGTTAADNDHQEDRLNLAFTVEF